MEALKRIRRICRTLGNIDTHFIAVTSLRTYCVSTKTQTKVRPVENKCGNNESRKVATSSVTIDETTIKRIQKLALVGFEYKQSKQMLEEAIAFVERLRQTHIDETVRPMYSTLENEHIHLREDVALPRDTVDQQEILENAKVLEEKYFVAPLVNGKSGSQQ